MKHTRVKSILLIFTVIFISLIMPTSSFSDVSITMDDPLTLTTTSPYIYYNNTTFPYHNSFTSSGYFVNSSYAYDNVTDKTFSETTIDSILCYNTYFLGILSTSDNQTITEHITNITALHDKTAVWISASKFTNSANFKSLCIYENGKKQYEYNSYDGISKNFNRTTIIISHSKPVNLTLKFDPENQTVPITEYGKIYYTLYFDLNDSIYYQYHGIININITTKTASYFF